MKQNNNYCIDGKSSSNWILLRSGIAFRNSRKFLTTPFLPHEDALFERNDWPLIDDKAVKRKSNSEAE